LVAVLLAVVELTGPAVAERRDPTPWHAHHIAERYSLLTIIALGEGIVGTTAALSAVVEHGWTWQVALVGLAGTGLVFGMWWCYFTLPSAEILHHFRNAKSFAWGYGHLVIFASVAATGAGLHVVAGYLEEAAAGRGRPGEQPAHHIGATGAVLAVVIPVAVYTAALYVIYTWLVGEFDRFHSWLLSGTVVLLVLPVLLAVGGAAIPACLLVLMLAPVVTIVGYETVGHAHQAEVITRVTGRGNGPRPDR
ncbi:MAG: low temperature requirement protein A, partial [Nakamurella sp.]